MLKKLNHAFEYTKMPYTTHPYFSDYSYLVVIFWNASWYVPGAGKQITYQVVPWKFKSQGTLSQVTSGKRGDTKVCFVGEVQLNFVIQETARGIAVVCWFSLIATWPIKPGH